MTSYVPLLPTLPPRRGPCQDRATSEAVGTLDQRSRRSDCPFLGCARRRAQLGAGGHLCEKRDAARSMGTRTSYSTPTATASSSPSNGDGPASRPTNSSAHHRSLQPTTAPRTPPPIRSRLPDRGPNPPRSVRQPNGTAPAPSVLLLWSCRRVVLPASKSRTVRLGSRSSSGLGFTLQPRRGGPTDIYVPCEGSLAAVGPWTRSMRLGRRVG
jgi:hypothetical protein